MRFGKFKCPVRNRYVRIISHCDEDTYRFLEGDETACISSERAGHGTGTRPSPSSKTAKGQEHISLT